MEITEVRILLVDEEPLRVLVNIVLYNCFAIKELRIIRGPKGHFVGMPKRRKKDGTLSEIVSTITAEARNMLEEKVFAEYEQIIGNRSPDISYLERRPTARQYKEVS
jgi:stage V sporulation protein G